MSQLTPRSAPEPNANLCHETQTGFALTELLAGTSSLAVLIGVLLPAIQKEREAAARAGCQDNLKQIGIAIQTFGKQCGCFPSTLGEALRATQCPASGAMDGYKASTYLVGKGAWSLTLNPVPGVTGSDSGRVFGTANNGFAIDMTPAPGAEEGRTRILDAARAHAAEAFSHIAALLPYEEQEALYRQLAPAVQQPGAGSSAFRVLAGPDGEVSLASVSRVFDGTSNTIFFGELAAILSAFWIAAARDLQLGAYAERWQSLPGLASVPDPDSPDAAPGTLPFFGYDSLASLTSRLVPGEAEAGQLQTCLWAAKQVAKDGNRPAEQAAMKSYLGTVIMSAGQKAPAISPINAQTLTSMGWASFPW